MPSLTELDVVNSCLSGIGIAPRTSLARPDRYAASIIHKLKRWNRQIQGRGWWFNDMEVEVTPDVDNDNRVDDQLPCNLISVEGPTGVPLSYKKPGYLYQLNCGEPVTSKTKVRVLYELPFAELPDTAQFYIQDCTVLDFTGHLDGSKVDIDKALQTSSLIQLNAENTRQRKVNLMHTSSFLQKLVAVRGHRPVINTW